MEKTKGGYLAGTVSIVINTILFAAKMWVGILTGSLALAADAWHTLSDSISSVVVVIGTKLSSKKADKEHPFGHGRWEHIASLFIALILGIIAYDFFRRSLEQLFNHERVFYGTWAIVVTAASILIKELLAQYSFYIARKTDNSSVKADGWHHRSDALSSVVVLVGILFGSQFWWIDSVLGIIIAIMLFVTTIMILKGVITKLLGERPSQELIDKIKEEITKGYGYDLDIHHIHIHNYIVHKELTMHIRLNKDWTIEFGHEIASNIEKIINDKFHMTATIHVEPQREPK